MFQDNMPACQTAMNYILICLIFGIYQLRKNGLEYHYSKLGVKCLMNAILDVEAWYWIYNSYNYTSLTSIQSIDCLSIPIVIIISKVALNKHYNLHQYGAIGICLIGVGILVYADYDEKDKSSMWGDMMCALGAILFGLSTVCQEWIVDDLDIYEYQGTVCWYAAAISIAKFIFLEGSYLVTNIQHKPIVVAPLGCLAVSQFIFYAVMPRMLSSFGSGAATINILAADLYAALAGHFIFKMDFHAMYIFGMLVICLGIVIYTMRSDSSQNSLFSDESSESLMKNAPQVVTQR